MSGDQIISLRVSFEIKEKLDLIAKQCRYHKKDLIAAWVLGTIVDHERKEFTTNCSSGSSLPAGAYEDLDK